MKFMIDNDGLNHVLLKCSIFHSLMEISLKIKISFRGGDCFVHGVCQCR